MDDIGRYVDWSDTRPESLTPRLTKYLKRQGDDSVFIDAGFLNVTDFPNSNIYSPCLNTQHNLICVPLRRKANVSEYLKLQGFPTNFKQVVSNTQMVKQIGNSMSVNVLKEILKRIY